MSNFSTRWNKKICRVEVTLLLQREIFSNKSQRWKREK